ncbi:MAG: D-2-hydroxyacid dehydrogenase [Flavobacteriales bacterium]|jgi:D-3-phosphoglycerate dehydrogenase|nr:D-2-hydroxyacid dehydrogenase [Flavobacteriales bacterium]
MKKILANDGVSAQGVIALEKAGYQVVTENVAQKDLIKAINDEGYVGLLVRSATKVREDLIDACPNLKLIGRGGVGMDNIDVEYARGKGLHVINTPAASSHSVAELVFAHLMGMARFVYDSNRQMPLEGEVSFKQLKKNYSKGIELKGKTMGIIGFGRIGQATAKIALGLGMDVCVYNRTPKTATITLDLAQGKTVDFEIETQPLEKVLMSADCLSLHLPAQKEPIIGKEQFEMMKEGVNIINAARGGVIDEVALMKALDEGVVAHAGLDVFDNEPKPDMKILMHSKISLTPHIGGQTKEAQARIGEELAEQIIDLLG